MTEKIIENFKLSQICGSGQCFRMERIGEDTFRVLAGDRYLEARQQGMRCTFSCPEEEFAKFWKNEIGENNEQCRHADNHLHKQLAAVGKMSLNHAQRGGYSGAGHHRQQRKGQNAHGQTFFMNRLLRQENRSFTQSQN